jgi:hypothetical protein
VPAAHHGIFFRVSAAVTYGAGGGGGVGSVGTCGGAGAGVVAAPSPDSAGSELLDGDTFPSPSPAKVWRASFERFNRCSGTSTKVISATDVVERIRPGLGSRSTGGRRQDSSGLTSLGASAGHQRPEQQRWVVELAESSFRVSEIRTPMVDVDQEAARWTVLAVRAPAGRTKR